MADLKRAEFTYGIVTMSDKGSIGEREDTSGMYLKETLGTHGYSFCHYEIIPDNIDRIVSTLIECCDGKKLSLVITTGGTGVAPTDVTPEAMDKVLDKEVPGIAELMRYESLKVTNRAALSRGKAGIRKETLIINLPGSLKAARENLDAVLDILDHALEKIRGDKGDCGG